jgi:hypothetical protein
VPAATEAAAVSAKAMRAMMTRRRSLMTSEGERVRVDWGAVEVLALGSCSGAR